MVATQTLYHSLMKKLLAFLVLLSIGIPTAIQAETGSGKKIVLVAGRPSHGWGAHEFNAGCLLMQKHLRAQYPELTIEVHLNGWPKDPDSAFKGASTVVIFCNGGQGHIAIPHLADFDKYMEKGVGLACLHYAVEVPIGPPAKHMLKWMGGYFEAHWSVNPHWKAEFTMLPGHEITNGVKPFSAQDEWYYHMRFVEDTKGLTPILSAHPPKETLKRKDGPHSGNPHVRKAVASGEIQHVGWAYDRPTGGRGFGFTGLHFHNNYKNDDFRKLVLNAIIWTAGMKVPEKGVESPTPTDAELDANQDYPKPKKK